MQARNRQLLEQSAVIGLTPPVTPSAMAPDRPQNQANPPVGGKWGIGNYGRIGVTLQITGELLCEAMDLRAGDRVLDVAAGNGNATLAAARRFCRVVSTDCVPALLEQSAARAAAEGLPVDYRPADAESLPFEEAQFDHTISTFGVMFARNPTLAAEELLRVTRRGGLIGLANWTPDGFVGQLFAKVGRFAPKAPNRVSPVHWGSGAFVQQLFEADSEQIDIKTRWFVFRYRSPEHWLEVFRTDYGPLRQLFESLGHRQQEQMTHELKSLIDRFNRVADGTVVVPASYLEVVITR